MKSSREKGNVKKKNMGNNNIIKKQSVEQVKEDIKNDESKPKRQRLSKSFIVAISGILLVIKEERNIKIHILATILAIILGAVLEINTAEWCNIAIVIGMVIAGELINSAIETLVDVVMPNYDIRAKRIKDVSAGAVLILAISAVVVGVIIFAPKLYELL